MTQVQQKKIGRFTIDYEVGAGGLGKVFKGVDSNTGKEVAIKILHEQYQMNRRFLGIFHRELLTVSGLKHKHIVQYIEANYEPPNCYIVTEFVDGWPLNRLIKHYKKIPPMVALSIAIDMLQGIDYLHLHDTIHSDLSSPNVLISKKGKVLLTDFGLACNNEVENYRNYMVGTPGFYSPEHITEASMRPASDIYCVGLLLFEMLTGEKAVVASKKQDEVLKSMKNIDFKKITSDDRRIQSGLRSICKKALRFRTTFRYKHAEKMIFDIYKLLKKYDIRYSRHAIHQLLSENGLSVAMPSKYLQDIYAGSEVKPDTFDDLLNHSSNDDSSDATEHISNQGNESKTTT